MSNTITKYNNEYYIPITIDKEFGELLNSMDKDLLAIEGLSREFLDIVKRHNEYSSDNLDNFSIEGNSNATGSKNYMSRNGEVYKSLDKLINYNMLWEQLKEDFGIEKANEIISEAIQGSFMIHDLTNNGVDSAYCSAMPAKNIMLKGRPYNDVSSKAPKYADSFMGQIIEFIIDASSRFAGAIAIPDFNIAFSYYTRKENLSSEKIEQLYQRLVHLVNNPYRSGSQSPFFNMALFTETGIYQAFGEYEYPDGSFAIDNIDEILKNQLIFAKYFGQGIEIDGVKKPVAFPVVTLNIIRDNIKEDYNYILKIIEQFNKFDNINLYVGAADKFASCCFDGEQKVVVNINDTIVRPTFENLYETCLAENNYVLDILTTKGFAKGKIVKKHSTSLLEIQTNNSKIIVTPDHICPVTKGDIYAKELIVGDKLLAYNIVEETEYTEEIISITELFNTNGVVYCFEMLDKENPYFVLDNGIITHNCRLINDTSKKNSINSFGAGAVGEQVTGSLRVISYNLYDIALQAVAKNPKNPKDEYFKILGEKMELGKKALYSQRKLVEKRFKEGYNIFYNIGWIKLEDFFSTYGAGGEYEAVKTIFGEDLNSDYTDENLEFGKLIPQFMEKFADENSTDFMKLNVEFLTPLESGARRLGQRIDINYGKRNTFVSNQLYPLTNKISLSRRLEIENELGGATSAGGILHISTEGEMPFDMKVKLIDKIITNYPNVEHFAFNKCSSFCEDGHTTFKNVDVCQHCGKPIIEKILRIIGYYKPVKNWSAARKKEFSQRKFQTLKQQIEFVQKEDEDNDDNS